jgi:hypothetical protein
MNKKQAEELTNDVLIADALLRVKTLENVLIAKGIFTKEEFQEEMIAVTKIIAKAILQKAHVPGDLDLLISKLEGAHPKDDPQN